MIGFDIVPMAVMRKIAVGVKIHLVHSPNANSEERSQTQIKGSAFGFLEDGRELNYNPHLTNRKK